jgi:hypothetical protein
MDNITRAECMAKVKAKDNRIIRLIAWRDFDCARELTTTTSHRISSEPSRSIGRLGAKKGETPRILSTRIIDS